MVKKLAHPPVTKKKSVPFRKSTLFDKIDINSGLHQTSELQQGGFLAWWIVESIVAQVFPRNTHWQQQLMF